MKLLLMISGRLFLNDEEIYSDLGKISGQLLIVIYSASDVLPNIMSKNEIFYYNSIENLNLSDGDFKLGDYGVHIRNKRASLSIKSGETEEFVDYLHSHVHFLKSQLTFPVMRTYFMKYLYIIVLIAFVIWLLIIKKYYLYESDNSAIIGGLLKE